MRRNEHSGRAYDPEMNEARKLVPSLLCIMAAGGIQAARRQSYSERMYLYKAAKKEFLDLQSAGTAPCQYRDFVQAFTRELRI